jgi:hypothetical protein
LTKANIVIEVYEVVEVNIIEDFNNRNAMTNSEINTIGLHLNHNL